MRRFDDDTTDLRQFVGRGGFGSEFRETSDQNDVRLPTNAHDEREYESMPRLPDQTIWVEKPMVNNMYSGMERVISDPPMSVRTKNQVFSSIGDRVGTMTSASQLDRSRGVGELGSDGGLKSRAEVRPSDLYLGQSAANSAKGRY